MRVTWDAVSIEQVLAGVHCQRFGNGCLDCSGPGMFASTVAGWRLYVEHDEGCPVLQRRRAEVGGAG